MKSLRAKEFGENGPAENEDPWLPHLSQDEGPHGVFVSVLVPRKKLSRFAAPTHNRKLQKKEALKTEKQATGKEASITDENIGQLSKIAAFRRWPSATLTTKQPQPSGCVTQTQRASTGA